jgi:DsbC/DsbD-like thiol-disulfide interchange protein
MLRIWAAALAMTMTASAQTVRPKATLSPHVADRVSPGENIELRLDVALPPELHVQSDKPRDPSLIPTALALTLPAGVSLLETVYPRAEAFTLSGGSHTLDVFGAHFTVAVKLAIAESAGDGDLSVAGRLRYQACNATSCFPPSTETTQWTLHVRGQRP